MDANHATELVSRYFLQVVLSYGCPVWNAGTHSSLVALILCRSVFRGLCFVTVAVSGYFDGDKGRTHPPPFGTLTIVTDQIC